MYNMTSVSILYFHPPNKFQIYNVCRFRQVYDEKWLKTLKTRELGRKQNEKKSL